MARVLLTILVNQGHLPHEFVFSFCDDLQAYGRYDTLYYSAPAALQYPFN